MSEGQTPAELKAIHDLLLSTKPDLPHPPCALCDIDKETKPMGDTLTKDELDAAVADAVAAANAAADQRIADAVAEATAPLTTELETLRLAAAGSELESAVAAATATLTDQVATKQSELEAAQATVAAVTTERDALLADKAEFEDAIAIAARKDERVAAVADIVTFPETFIAAQADAWAALDDDGWAAKLEELGGLKDIVTPAPGLPSRPSALLATAGAGAGGQGETASRRLIRAQAALSTTAPSGN